MLFRKLSTADASYLESSISGEEIKSAVWDCEGLKAPGPDGFNFKFIKFYWDIMKDEYVSCVNYFDVNGKFANGCNPSFIVLIPKKVDPLGFVDYRPTSLIKILASRLAKVIPSIIGRNQTAFIAGRQILDGCLVANEVIRMASIENHKLMLFKVDFEKAFDSLNWNFLHNIMRQMGLGKNGENGSGLAFHRLLSQF